MSAHSDRHGQTHTTELEALLMLMLLATTGLIVLLLLVL